MGIKKFIRDFAMGNLVRKEAVYVPKLKGSLLEGRSALVTGGTSGIGFSIAEAFLNNGADVVITGRTEGRVEAAVGQLSSIAGSGRVSGIAFDVADADNADANLRRAIEISVDRRIDMLVNNAGVVSGGPMSAITVEEFDRVLSTNLRGAYFLSQAFGEHLIAQSVSGNILNIASSSSLRPAVSPYTISKWGIRGLTVGLAKALAPHGVTVNGIAPGPTATPMLQGDDAGYLELASSPVGRYATPEEIADMAVVLVSDIGRMIVGDIVYMTGGAGVITVDDMKYVF